MTFQNFLAPVSGSTATIPGGGTVEAMREIVEEVMLPTHTLTMSDDVGVEITRPEVQQYISDNRRLLHSAFLLYAEASEGGALITLDHFRELMDDCGVMSAMTATTSGRAKFDFQAETCFLQTTGATGSTAGGSVGTLEKRSSVGTGVLPLSSSACTRGSTSSTHPPTIWPRHHAFSQPHRSVTGAPVLLIPTAHSSCPGSPAGSCF
ncbi:unnamed protein product [Ectocarpus sp. CCAP 1310/34]|nr:unnamed protein product [Ectocarpus sp. CCAP 1310/34]